MNIYYANVQMGFDIDPDPTGILMASGSSMLERNKEKILNKLSDPKAKLIWILIRVREYNDLVPDPCFSYIRKPEQEGIDFDWLISWPGRE